MKVPNYISKSEFVELGLLLISGATGFAFHIAHRDGLTVLTNVPLFFGIAICCLLTYSRNRWGEKDSPLWVFLFYTFAKWVLCVGFIYARGEYAGYKIVALFAYLLNIAALVVAAVRRDNRNLLMALAYRLVLCW